MNSFPAAPILNALSVDVEEYFQVYALSSQISRDQWPCYSSRVAASTHLILDVLAQRQVTATFFILGWVAERCPELVRTLTMAGHEIASHGMDHRRVDQMTPTEFLDDIRQCKSILEDLSGKAVLGYRAPNYSIGSGNLWALAVLAEAGYRYSSSIYPIRHDHYGMPLASPTPFYPHPQGVVEIPVASLAWGRWRVAAGGGGYFRFYPYWLSRWLIRTYNQRHGPAVFFLHPWELDPGQPKVAGLSARSRFRHYLNLHLTSQRLACLVDDFAWAPLAEVFAGVWGDSPPHQGPG